MNISPRDVIWANKFIKAFHENRGTRSNHYRREMAAKWVSFKTNSVELQQLLEASRKVRKLAENPSPTACARCHWEPFTST